MKKLISILLAAWFVAVLCLGASGVFERPSDSPPLPILIGWAAPLIVFAAGYAISPRFREFVLDADPRLFTGIQAWRAGGLVFLALEANGILPGLFSWPAGLGDIAIGVTAPWIVMALIRRPDFAVSRTFVVWNVLGIVDLILAVSLGALSAGFVPGLVGGVTTAAMARLPLVLIPAYLVPLFLMMHAAVLLQARQRFVRSRPVDPSAPLVNEAAGTAGLMRSSFAGQ